MMSADIISLMATDRRVVEARFREQLDGRLEEIERLRGENRTLRALRGAQANRLIEQGGQVKRLEHQLAEAQITHWMLAAAIAWLLGVLLYLAWGL